MKKVKLYAKKNLLLLVSQVMLFLGIGLISLYFLPHCIFPYARVFKDQEQAIFGDLNIFVKSNEYGIIDYADFTHESTSPLYNVAFAYVLPNDESFYNRIENVDGVSSILKRHIPHSNLGYSVNKIDVETGRYDRLYEFARFVAYDFSNLNHFYSFQDTITFPDVSLIGDKAILFRDNMVDELSKEGKMLNIGDSIKIERMNLNTIAQYQGKYFPLKISEIKSPEATMPSSIGYILNHEAFSDLFKIQYYYKFYSAPPSIVDEVVFPGISEDYPVGLQYSPIGYNQLLIRLDKNANKEDVKNEIQKILDEYNREGSLNTLVVDEPIHNYYKESTILGIKIDRMISRSLAIVVMIGSFIVAMFGVQILISDQRDIMNLYHILGRNLTALSFDVIKELSIVCYLPFSIGCVCSLIYLLYTNPGVFVIGKICFASLLFMILFVSIFTFFSFAMTRATLKKIMVENSIV